MSTTINDALEQVRAEAQQLHQRLDAANAAQQTTLRAELQKTVEHVAAIAATLRESASEQNTHTKRHLDEAANAFRDAGQRVRDALNHISEAASANPMPASTEKK